MAWVGTSAGKLSAAGSSLVCEAVTSEGWSVSMDGSDGSSEACTCSDRNRATGIFMGVSTRVELCVRCACIPGVCLSLA